MCAHRGNPHGSLPAHRLGLFTRLINQLLLSLARQTSAIGAGRSDQPASTFFRFTNRSAGLFPSRCDLLPHLGFGFKYEPEVFQHRPAW